MDLSRIAIRFFLLKKGTEVLFANICSTNLLTTVSYTSEVNRYLYYISQ
jgi:hypothetical protein